MLSVFSTPPKCVNPECHHEHNEENYLLSLPCGDYLCLLCAKAHVKPIGNQGYLSFKCPVCKLASEMVLKDLTTNIKFVL
jgi:phage FluMu protein Com